jgi:hypothetical protein
MSKARGGSLDTVCRWSGYGEAGGCQAFPGEPIAGNPNRSGPMSRTQVPEFRLAGGHGECVELG